MRFTGFDKKDFQTFHIDGLDERMQAIQERIQPKFQEIGHVLKADISMLVGHEMYLHIAKHARRTKNPPKDTWFAISENNRGYKKHPHFQFGLFDDHLFIWLAFIYELPNKEDIANIFIDHVNQIHVLPKAFVVSLDHTQKNTIPITDHDMLMKGLERFRDVKKGEFLIGRHVKANDPVVQDGDKLLALAKNTFEALIPLYQLSLKNV